jgi:kynurenine formamidase
MSKTVCLSHLIRQNTPAYGDRDRIFIRSNSSMKGGDSANSSCWIFSNNHIGTHIDSPRHFSEEGKKTYDYPAGDYIFRKVCLIDIPCTDAVLIAPDKLLKTGARIPEDVELLFIRTGYERYRDIPKYWNDNPGLAPELAEYFRERFPLLRCVGFDFISLTSWKFREAGRASHKAFLCPGNGKKEILVIEDVALEKVTGSLLGVIVAPLFMEDGNGGAVTIFAKMTD